MGTEVSAGFVSSALSTRRHQHSSEPGEKRKAGRSREKQGKAERSVIPSVLPLQELQGLPTREEEQNSDDGHRHGDGGQRKQKIRVKGEAQLCLS